MDQVINLIHQEEFKKEKTVLLVDSPFDILRMVEGGVPVDQSRRGRRRILPYLYLSAEEIFTFKKLFLLGIRCECRDLPLAQKKDLSVLLEKLGL